MPRASLDELITIHSGDASRIRREALEELHDPEREAVIATFKVADADGQLRYTSIEWTGSMPDVARQIAQMASGAPTVEALERSIRCPSEAERTQFLTLRTRTGVSDDDELREREVHQRFGKPFGLGDEARLLIYDGREFAAWVGAYRAPDQPIFDEPALEELNEAVDGLRSVMTAAHRFDKRHLNEGPQYAVAKPDGTIKWVTDAAGRWLTDSSRERLARRIRRLQPEGGHQLLDVVEGVEVRASAMNAEDGDLSYHLQFSETEPVEMSIQSMLTPAQYQVARLAAAGKNGPDIAEIRQCSVHTVRTHLRDAYRRLDINSRHELDALFDEESGRTG